MFHDIFTSLLDDILFERVLEQSLESHQSELFKKTNDLILDLETKVYESEEPTNCFICYSDMCKEDTIYLLDCRHMYHEECLLEAVKHQHNSCPICRKPIPVQQIKIENKSDSIKEHSIIYHET